MPANRAPSTSAVVLTATLIALLASACGVISPSQPSAPTPTPVPVQLLYESVKREHRLYDDQLKDWEGQRFPPFKGRITRIEGATVFFRVYDDDVPLLFLLLPFSLEKDGYFKCKFKDKEIVETQLSAGQVVVVEGVLDKAFRRGFLGMTVFGDPNSVRLEDCELLPKQQE